MNAMPLILLAVIARAAEVAAAVSSAAPAPVPFYLKVLGYIGVAAFFWKLLQSKIPDLLGFLRPLAIRGVDGFVALVLAYPLARWLILGDKDNFLKTANQLLDGLADISKAVEERLKADLDAADGGSAAPAARTDPPPPSGT